MRRLIAAVLLALLIRGYAIAQETVREQDSSEQKELSYYLTSHWQSPEDYVVGKFKNHQIVFLGEYHRIKHDPELVQALIPRLYKAGVYNLGFEFGAFADQADVDRMLNAPAYDETVARKSLFDDLPVWGYKEYEEIYRAAWELNHSLPPDAPRFRVVNLNLKYPEQKKMDDDAYMAKSFLMRSSPKSRKLVYCGMHHAFTRYHQPVYDFKEGFLERLNDQRMGNLIYKQIGNQAMTICLHFPWVSSKGWDEPAVRPANGMIDELMATFKDTRVGFDVVGTPFESVSATDTCYAFGHPGFKLADFTDGYIYQKPFREYQGVTVDPQFITKENLKEAVDMLADLEAAKNLTSPEVFVRVMQEDADMQKRFKDVH